MNDDENKDMTTVLDRMVELRWVERYAYSPARGFVIDYTELGQQQLGGFWHFLNELSGDGGLERLDNVFWRGLVTAALLKFGQIPPPDSAKRP